MNEDNNYLLTDEEQDRLYPLSESVKKQWQKWVPEGYKITNMQIYDAMSRGIPIPNGDPLHDQEYFMFLKEHILVTKKEVEPIIYIDRDTHEIPKKPTNKKGHHSYLTGFLSSLFRKKSITAKELKEAEEIINDNPIKNNEDLLPDIEEPVPSIDETVNDDTIKDIDIEEDEIAEALNEYMSEDKPDVVVKIVERFKSFVLPLLLAALIAFLATCFRGAEDKNKAIISESVMSYVMTHTEFQNHEEALHAAMEKISMGDQVELSDGQKFNTNSAMTGITKELGKEFDKEAKYEGTYPITGFSMVRKSDNKIVAYIEDFYTQKDNTKLSSFVDESLANNNLNFDDVNIEFHFGRTDKQSGERSRLGWIEDGNVVLNEAEIKKSVEEAITYKDTIENFKGDHITITTGDGEVQIPVKDASGNLYKPGDKVVGSDNKVYEISELEEVVKETTINGEKSSNISFSLKNGKLAVALPFITLALLDYVIKKRKNAKAEKNPYFKEISSDDVPEYIESFQRGQTKISKEHKGTIYSSELLSQIILEAYNEITGEKVESIDELMYEVQNDSIIVYKKDAPENSVDVTEYFINKTGFNIGTGWDNDAAEDFENRKGGR